MSSPLGPFGARWRQLPGLFLGGHLTSVRPVGSAARAHPGGLGAEEEAALGHHLVPGLDAGQYLDGVARESVVNMKALSRRALPATIAPSVRYVTVT
jgi:hypothetical protein